MTKFNFIKKLKFPNKHFKIFILTLFAFLILIPFLVFAIDEVLNTPAGGYQQLKNNATTDLRPVYWNTTDNRDSISTSTGACIINNSSNSYFVPTRTISEWNAYTGHMNDLGMFLTQGYGLPGGTCQNGTCEEAGGEACDNSPKECGSYGSDCPASI